MAVNVYEGMFILDSNRYSRDQVGVSGQIGEMIQKLPVYQREEGVLKVYTLFAQLFVPMIVTPLFVKKGCRVACHLKRNGHCSGGASLSVGSIYCGHSSSPA